MSDWQPQSTRGTVTSVVAPAAVIVAGFALFILWGLTF